MPEFTYVQIAVAAVLLLVVLVIAMLVVEVLLTLGLRWVDRRWPGPIDPADDPYQLGPVSDRSVARLTRDRDAEEVRRG